MNQLSKTSIRLAVNTLSFLLFIICGFYLFSLSHNWKPEWDSAYYLMISKSILNGNGFFYLDYPCLKIPFGFPLLISPLIWLTNCNFFVLNFFILLFAGLGFLMIYKLFRSFFSHHYALLITFLTALSPLVLFHTGFIMIDIPYMAVSLLALFSVITYLHNNRIFFKGLIAIACLLAAFFLRTVGVALITGIFFYCIFNNGKFLRTKQFIILSVLLLLPIAGWITYTRSLQINIDDPVWQLPEFIPSNNEYKRYRFDDPLSKITNPASYVKRGIENMAYYAGTSMSIISGLPINTSKDNLQRIPFIVLALFGFGSCIIFLGFADSLIRRRLIFDFYFLFYMGILLSWSAREQRYLIPVLPFLFHYFLNGINLITRFFHFFLPFFKKNSTNVIFAFVTLYVAFFSVSSAIRNIHIIRDQHTQPYHNKHYSDFFKSIDWVKVNTSPDARIVSTTAPICAYFSGRWCVSFPRIKNADILLSYLYKIKCDYLIMNSLESIEVPYLKPVIEANPEIFVNKFKTGYGNIYRIDRKKLGSKLSLNISSDVASEKDWFRK